MWQENDKINDRFLILEVLGGGSFGDAYRAVDLTKGYQVAIKTLNQKQQNKIDFEIRQKKFRREADILKGLSHPHIVKVSEVIEVDGLLGMVMEYISGEDLEKYVERRGKLDEVEALRYIQQVGTALIYLHEENLPHKVKLLHRDIKPNNIMLRADNREAVLIDFGLAREYIDGTTMLMTEDKTHGYAPIEQYDRKGHFGAYTDVYALAATLYHLLTGNTPLPSNFRKSNHSLSLPSTLNPDISSVVENAIVKGLELYPKDRPQTMAEFLKILGLEVPSIPTTLNLGDISPVQISPISEPKPPVYIPAPTADTATSDTIDPPNLPLDDSVPSFFEQMLDPFEVEADSAIETSEINLEEYINGKYIDRQDLNQSVIIPPTSPLVTPSPIVSIVPIKPTPKPPVTPPPIPQPEVRAKPRYTPPPAPPKTPLSKPATRRNFIKGLVFPGLSITAFGLVLIQLGKKSTDTPNLPVPSSPSVAGNAPKFTKIQFTSVKLNDKGVIIAKPSASAQIYTEALGNGVALKMVKIPDGKFMMGSPESEKDRQDRESPQHQVTVPEFYLAQTLVTQAQYQAIMGKNPANFKGNDKLPVDNVSWLDAVEFCEKLSQKTNRTYRLPSEAEWEYACRAGTNTPYAFGETINPSVVNYNGRYPYGGAAKGEYRQKTTPIGSFPPNLFGLYDMHGNLFEWCLDEWTSNYNGVPTDGSAGGDINSRENNKRRLLRGGSWVSDAQICRSACRFDSPASGRHSFFGFRVVGLPFRSS